MRAGAHQWLALEAVILEHQPDVLDAAQHVRDIDRVEIGVGERKTC
jgi:hypothetical protein